MVSFGVEESFFWGWVDFRVVGTSVGYLIVVGIKGFVLV